MKDLVLFNEYKVVGRNSHKTKAEFFKDLRVGDYIEIQHRLERTTGASGGGCYASKLTAVNLSTGATVTSTQNRMLNNLANFVLKEVDVIRYVLEGVDDL